MGQQGSGLDFHHVGEPVWSGQSDFYRRSGQNVEYNQSASLGKEVKMLFSPDLNFLAIEENWMVGIP